MLLALLPVVPLIGFLILAILGPRLGYRANAFVGVGSIFIVALISGLLVNQLNTSSDTFISASLWQWFSLSFEQQDVPVNIAFHLDSLSAVMIMVVTGIGFLIHLFAAVYMEEDPNFSRFMAYMNLFISAMLVLVLADNLVLIYLGWEGVGICSFLLIGFWYQDPSNVRAAKKAFIVTRVGDASLAIGLILLFNHVGSLNIQHINNIAVDTWVTDSDSLYWICLFILGGAVGKSAQLPLQTWLPDAMAGPTPVSALIHAATMVTAGVYLIARLNPIYALSPQVMFYISCIGTATLLIAGIAALAQNDIKRVLAYSTMSQIGYMMVALGAGVFSAAIFHLMTHAFFKALLFLTAGAIIYALHHQQDMSKMGGLLKKLPFESCLLIVGLACLVAFPGTSGFFSKESIIAGLWSSSTAGSVIWWGAVIGAFITALYSMRLIKLTLFGSANYKGQLTPMSGSVFKIALLVLAILSLLGGVIHLDFDNIFILSNFIMEQATINSQIEEPKWLHTAAIAIPMVGLLIGWRLFNSEKVGAPKWLVYWCQSGLGFDWIYNTTLVNPSKKLAQINQQDIINSCYAVFNTFLLMLRDVFVSFQNGLIRWYAAAFTLVIVFALLGVIL